MNLIERILNRLLPCKIIVNCDRDPYLHRWYLLRTSRVAVFIHKFVRSDEDRALHDHPWNFLVIPVWRGYVEHSECMCWLCQVGVPRDEVPPVSIKRRVYPFLGTRYRTAEYRHRVELIEGKPSWSIFFRFKERRVWGFWANTGFEAWNKWWQEKCE